MSGAHTSECSAAIGASSGSRMLMYVKKAAIGCLRQMNFATSSDSRVHERFQRVCWMMNARSVLGTIVCETAFFS